MSSNILVETYRPSKFEDIILTDVNKQILSNIVETNIFPNLLFYGPPGTGKTTTILNIIKKYQLKNGKYNKELIMHLNASDERGIEIIRTQINNFVSTKCLFMNGLKFVILDEVDAMTKTAQLALKYLIQNSNSNNIRYCLICNYISRINYSLQHEFIKLKFNNLPEQHIINFLTNISEKEQLHYSETILKNIQKLYSSDIRSMINCMEVNKTNKIIHVLDDTLWNEFYTNLLLINKNKYTLPVLNKYVYDISCKYNVEPKKMFVDFFNYLINKKVKEQIYNQTHNIQIKQQSSIDTVSLENILKFVENVVHNNDLKTDIYINYVLSWLKQGGGYNDTD